MSSSPIVDRIRIIPRPDDFLDRNVGSSGEVFFNKGTNSLRVYSGKVAGGFEIARADLANVDTTAFLQASSLNNISIEEFQDVMYMPNSIPDEGQVLVWRTDHWMNEDSLSGGASVDVAETAPTSPQSGNLWLDTSNGKLYIYINDGDSQQWIQPTTSSGGSGGAVTETDTLASVTTRGSTTSNAITINNTLTANDIQTSGAGTPTITSASTITLTAADATIVTGGPFRLPSFTTTQKNALAGVNGDMIYDSTLNKAQVYENGAWASLV
jgi:hypothetical protein|tara:strand:- start:224 stop:1030 length:807 start_codon:yes stop_codon:yes gene_type:complete